jgi:hypothetical protein
VIGQPHILSVTDIERGIQALAADLLGDASLWTELVQVNRLTPPYMTVDPSQVYGAPVATVTLAASISADATTLVLSNQPQATSMLYFSSASLSGLIAESVNVRSYDGMTFNFAVPLVNSYPQGAKVQLFSLYYVGNANVLLPGDVLFLPVADTQNFTMSNTSQLTDAFGTDIAYPVSFANGGLATVSGMNTLNQRMVAVIQTQQRSLPLHLEWGSTLLPKVGQSTTRTQWSAATREALMQLPEIATVNNASSTATGTNVAISATVYTTASNTAIELSSVPLTNVGD